jgi:CPA1 family monovalent cation:H+ antiporter
VGVVIFLVALSTAQGAQGLIGHGAIAGRLIVESAGGGAIGVATGLLAARAMRATGSETVALTVSLALVLATYRLALALGVSGPIAVVAAGLVVGRGAAAEGGQVRGFWSMVDELLNAMLFLLIGFETLTVAAEHVAPFAVIAAIPFSLVARAASVAAPMLLLSIRSHDRGRGIAVLTWAGLRGGVSVALALTLPESRYRPELLVICYAVVVFSIVVQGLTMPAFVRRMQAARPVV